MLLFSGHVSEAGKCCRAGPNLPLVHSLQCPRWETCCHKELPLSCHLELPLASSASLLSTAPGGLASSVQGLMLPQLTHCATCCTPLAPRTCDSRRPSVLIRWLMGAPTLPVRLLRARPKPLWTPECTQQCRPGNVARHARGRGAAAPPTDARNAPIAKV